MISHFIFTEDLLYKLNQQSKHKNTSQFQVVITSKLIGMCS